MLEEDLITRVRNFAFKNSQKDDIHGFSHVERVFNLCVELGRKLDANMLILKISALLHDIGRIRETDESINSNHAEISGQMAFKFLTSKQFEISPIDIQRIMHCIRAHSFSNEVIPKTLEAKILSDADKLDALGAIGLYRTIGFSLKNQGGLERVIEHLENKIMKLKEQMNLDISKKIAEDRHQIISDFYEKVKREISCNTKDEISS